MCVMVTDGGATPRMVMSSKPWGGKSRPICMQMRNSTPNHTGSMPKAFTIGMKIGRVIIIMLTWSTKMPRKIRKTIMPIRIWLAVNPCSVMSCTKPELAPEKDKICAKVVAPKKAALAVAEGEYSEAMTSLQAKQAELAEVMDKLETMRSKLAQLSTDKKNLEDKYDDCNTKLERAEKLLSGLGGEKVRW